MTQEEIQQAACEKKLVPSVDRVKISATNMRIEPSVPQKKETLQVILDIIKASPCFKAFAITADRDSRYMSKSPNKEFVAPPSEEDLLAFLIGLGYKGPLVHLSRIFIEHMHQPWRTLAIIINKSLSRKTSSNDRLRQSRVAILWGINQSEAYQTFIKYSTGLIPPKKSRGKWLQGKKSAITPKPASVEVSDESDPEPAKRQTRSKRKSEKKVSISADDNSIPELDVTLELAKSMSLAEIQPHVVGSSKGTGVSPGVPDELTIILTTSSEGTGTKPRIPNKEETGNKDVDWLYSNEEEDKDDGDVDDRSIDIIKTDDDKETDDEFVHDDVDGEMKDVENDENGKDDKEIVDAKNTKVTKGDCNDPLRKEDHYIIIMASHQSIFKKA
nr:hypothetical protein [Tanacetum cinerariifolium]